MPYRVLTSLFLLFSFYSHAEEPKLPHNDFRSGMEPSTLVHSCVNLLSGGYQYSNVDLSVDSPAPFQLLRTYDSSNLDGWCIGKGFHFELPLRIHGCVIRENHFLTRVEEGDGRFLYFKGVRKGNTIQYKIDPYFLRKGHTNYSSMGLSGQSNLYQLSLTYRNYDKKMREGEWVLRYGDGTTHFYRTVADVKDANNVVAVIKKTRLPSGHTLHYQLSLNRGAWDILRIKGKDFTESITFWEVGFSFDEKIPFIRSSLGDVVSYSLKKEAVKWKRGLSKGSMSFNYLQRVSGTQIPNQSYRRLRKNFPNGIRVSHFTLPGGISEEVHYQGDGKVKSIYNGSRLKCRIEYKGKGKYCIYNAKGEGTSYTLDENQRLKRVQTHLGAYQEYQWDSREGRLGNLTASFLIDKKRKTLLKTEYVYDHRGNVIQEKISNASGQTRICNSKYSSNGFNLLLERDDGERHISSYEYLTGTNLLTAKYTGNGKTYFKREFYRYDAHHLLIEKIEDNGVNHSLHDLTGVLYRKIWRYTPLLSSLHPGSGKPLETTLSYFDPRTRKEILLEKRKYYYNGKGKIATEVAYDALGRHRYTHKFSYDKKNRIISETERLGRTTEYTYDTRGDCIRKNQRWSDSQTFYSFDEWRQLTKKSVKYRNGTCDTTTYQYDPLGQLIREVDPFCNKREWSYDAAGRPLSQSGPPILTPDGLKTPTSRFSYDLIGNCIEEIDSLNNKVQRAYDLFSNLTCIRYPDGNKERFKYSRNGRLIEKQFINGSYETYTYDTLGHCIKKSFFSSKGKLISQEEKRYEGKLLIDQIDPLGVVTTFRYDGAGRLVEKKCGERIEQFTYDSLGFQDAHWVKLNQDEWMISLKQYDIAGRVIKTVEGDHQTSLVYDLSDRLLSKTEWISKDLAATTLYHYNPRGLLACKINPLNEKTHFKYEINTLYKGVPCLKTESIDPLGRSVTTYHDTKSLLIKTCRKDPYGVLISNQTVEYNLKGKAVREISDRFFGESRLGAYTVEREYNSMGAEIGLTEQNTKKTRKKYTPEGNLASIQKPNGTLLTYKYSTEGNLSEIQSSDGTIHYQFTYDTKRQQLTSYDLIHDLLCSKEYDIYGNVIRDQQGELSLSCQYDRLNRATKITLPDLSTIEYNYTGRFLHSIQRGEYLYTYLERNFAGGTLLAQGIGNSGSIDYTWDLLGRLRSIASNDWKEEIPEGGFDPCGNLLKIIGKETSCYTYDPLNQLTSENESTYQHDSLNNLQKKNDTTYKINELNQIDTFQYDLNGNLLNDSELIYQYDGLDRLISVEKPNVFKEDYIYSYEGRRLSRNQEKFLYQGGVEIARYENNIRQELQILGKGRQHSLGATVCMEIQGKTYGVLSDIRGNITSLIDPNTGTPISIQQFSAFGEILSSENPLSSWGYSGKRYERSGLIYFGQRYYQPKLHRWINPDPIGFADGPNLYAYVHNRPTTFFDPYGLSSNKLDLDRERRIIKSRRSNTSRRTWKDLRQGITSFPPIRNTGSVAEQVFHQILPSCYLKDRIFIAATREMQGKKSSTYWKKRGWHHLEQGIKQTEASYHVILGIGQTENSAMEVRDEICEGVTGIKTVISYQQNEGMVSDLSLAGKNHLGNTQGAEELTERFRTEAQRLLLSSKDPTYFQAVHSRGAQEFYKVCQSLTSQERGIMVVINLGGAICIPEWDYKGVENIVNPNDIVPRTSPSYPRDKKNITFTDHKTPFGYIRDHYITSPGYMDPLRESFKKYVKMCE